MIVQPRRKATSWSGIVEGMNCVLFHCTLYTIGISRSDTDKRLAVIMVSANYNNCFSGVGNGQGSSVLCHFSVFLLF